MHGKRGLLIQAIQQKNLGTLAYSVLWNEIMDPLKGRSFPKNANGALDGYVSYMDISFLLVLFGQLIMLTSPPYLEGKKKLCSKSLVSTPN